MLMKLKRTQILMSQVLENHMLVWYLKALMKHIGFIIVMLISLDLELGKVQLPNHLLQERLLVEDSNVISLD
ncbi:hypothetical protein KSP39_PZI012634 [Platanthera zijinensis]|uniref:Uncharacterized protein n=1 Tax=Platanthera zijinensis TaxID=2320716 RepID=A0AAP0G4V7_9ASPA